MGRNSTGIVTPRPVGSFTPRTHARVKFAPYSSPPAAG
jgi:hypothetical protein